MTGGDDAAETVDSMVFGVRLPIPTERGIWVPQGRERVTEALCGMFAKWWFRRALGLHLCARRSQSRHRYPCLTIAEARRCFTDFPSTIRAA